MIEHNIILLILASLFGLFMVWSIGANDLANIMSTTVGSKAITIKQAIFIAIIFEVAGAVLGGTHVAQTMQNGIIDTKVLNYPPEIFIYGMLAVLLASASWLTLGSRFGLPVSITNAIVGAVVGFGVLVLGVHAIHWDKVEDIAISWVISPLGAGAFAYLLFYSVQNLILSTDKPAKRAKRLLPFYLFLVGFVLAEMTIVKILAHFDIFLRLHSRLLLAIISGILVVIVGQKIMRRFSCSEDDDLHSQFEYVEKLFAVLMMFTACVMVYAHGSNDIAIAVGPIASIVSLLTVGHAFHNGFLTYSILSLGALVVVGGLLTYGHKIIATVGAGITHLTPSRAYCATIAAATAVIISTSFGIPVSATQTLVGAIFGVGLARGIGALDLKIVRRIIISWIVTIPIVAILTVIFFNIIRYIFKL